jgi:putative peptidoglycan lipid II flippase
LSAPFLVAFMTIPDLIMRGVFLRGAFTAQDAAASAAVLSAYGFGLLAIVLVRSAVASFQARGDTFTPMAISLGAVALNVALKLVFYRSYGAVALAGATAVGAWINLVLLVWIACRRGIMRPDATLGKVALAVGAASLALLAAALLGQAPSLAIARRLGRFPNESQLLMLGAGGACVYAAVLAGALAVLGVRRAATAMASPG